MMKHTPGPWTVDRWSDKQGSKGISIKSIGGVYIANIVMQLDDREMDHARLIAAAPDTLKALAQSATDLEDIKSRILAGTPTGVILRQIDRRVDAARAAIAKAEGRE